MSIAARTTAAAAAAEEFPARTRSTGGMNMTIRNRTSAQIRTIGDEIPAAVRALSLEQLEARDTETVCQWEMILRCLTGPDAILVGAFVRRGASPMDAEDICQQAALKVFEAISNGTFKHVMVKDGVLVKTSLRRYINAHAFGLFRDERRKAARRHNLTSRVRDAVRMVASARQYLADAEISGNALAIRRAEDRLSKSEARLRKVRSGARLRPAETEEWVELMQSGGSDDEWMKEQIASIESDACLWAERRTHRMHEDPEATGFVERIAERTDAEALVREELLPDLEKLTPRVQALVRAYLQGSVSHDDTKDNKRRQDEHQMRKQVPERTRLQRAA
jgi:hypothetical protein